MISNSRPYKAYQMVTTVPPGGGIPPPTFPIAGGGFTGAGNPLDPINEVFQNFISQILGKVQDTWNSFCDYYKLGCAIKGHPLPEQLQEQQKKNQQAFNQALTNLTDQLGKVLLTGGAPVPGYAGGTQAGCVTACKKIQKPGYSMSPKQSGDRCYCNFKWVGSQAGCSAACENLRRTTYQGYAMNPQQSGGRCYCNFQKCGTQSGCTAACRMIQKTGYTMSPRQLSCRQCLCNFKWVGSQAGCEDSCRKIRPSNTLMNPKQSGGRCYCNFVRCGTQSGCERACPSRSGYRKNPRQVSCTRCYCNYTRISTSGGGGGGWTCPYSGCGNQTTSIGCYGCRCRNICKSYPGTNASVRADGSCHCY